MAWFLLIAISVNVLLYSALAIWAARHALREELPRIRPLAWGLAAVAGAFVLGALTRLLLVGVRLEWLDGRVSDFLLSEWHLVQSLVATSLGITGFVMVRRLGRPLRQAERIAGAVSERIPTRAELAELGLTPRENEVIVVIASGKTSDQEIAEALFISPSTAATHVKNILRKTGLRSRRDLALLSLARNG